MYLGEFEAVWVGLSPSKFRTLPPWVFLVPSLNKVIIYHLKNGRITWSANHSNNSRKSKIKGGEVKYVLADGDIEQNSKLKEYIDLCVNT